MEALAAAVGAALRAMVVLLECALLAGIILRRERSAPFESFDVLSGLGLAALLAWSIHEVVRPRWRDIEIRNPAPIVRLRVPSTSGADLVVDALAILFGAAWISQQIRHAQPDVSGTWGMGVAALVVGVLLSTVRLIYWRRRPT